MPKTGRNSLVMTTKQLFLFLSLETANIETEKQVIITHHKDILCTQPRDTTGLAPCTQEEADTRIFLQVLH